MNITRTKVGLASLAVVAAGVPLGSSLASGATAAPKPAAGTIQVYVLGTSTNPNAPDKALITGAFSDHGTSPNTNGNTALLKLKHGTISVDIAALNKITNSSTFGTFSLASCSFSGTTKASVKLAKGTGAYVGIKGTIRINFSVAEQGSLLPSGACNPSNSAPAVASAFVVTGSGKVHF
jgi:hypothetical protein